MPTRSNDFQRLVFVVKHVLAGAGATVTESKMLPDLRTGEEQEVDVCVETSVAGHPFMVCFEVRDHKRKTDVTWVDQMRGKHEGMPTDALVLVSRSGFSKSARAKAKVCNIQLLSYDAATEEQLRATLPSTSTPQSVRDVLRPQRHERGRRGARARRPARGARQHAARQQLLQRGG